tara:strand:+ start:4427 stop:4858 length:432 start_codon:yes stop_codon:yes gene_type:complete
MKLTKEQLKQIIKEELQAVMMSEKQYSGSGRFRDRQDEFQDWIEDRYKINNPEKFQEDYDYYMKVFDAADPHCRDVDGEGRPILDWECMEKVLKNHPWPEDWNIEKGKTPPDPRIWTAKKEWFKKISDLSAPSGRHDYMENKK